MFLTAVTAMIKPGTPSQKEVGTGEGWTKVFLSSSFALYLNLFGSALLWLGEGGGKEGEPLCRLWPLNWELRWFCWSLLLVEDFFFETTNLQNNTQALAKAINTVFLPINLQCKADFHSIVSMLTNHQNTIIHPDFIWQKIHFLCNLTQFSRWPFLKC